MTRGMAQVKIAQPWVVLMHGKCVYGPFPTERAAREWAARRVDSYNYPSPSPEGVYFGAVSVVQLQQPAGEP